MMKNNVLIKELVHEFLTGQYVELAIYQTIKDVLQEISVKNHAEYDIYRNVRVADREGR